MEKTTSNKEKGEVFLIAMCSVSMTVDWASESLSGWGFVKTCTLFMSEWARCVGEMSALRADDPVYQGNEPAALAFQFPHPQSDLPQNSYKNNRSGCQNSDCQLGLHSFLTLSSPVYVSTHNNYLSILIEWQKIASQYERRKSYAIV